MIKYFQNKNNNWHKKNNGLLNEEALKTLSVWICVILNLFSMVLRKAYLYVYCLCFTKGKSNLKCFKINLIKDKSNGVTVT